MSAAISVRAGYAAVLLLSVGAAFAGTPDPRLREIQYDPAAIVTVPVKRGVVTHIVLDEGESITDVASGLGADCSKPESAWCISAQAGGHNVFVKAKSTAAASNNLEVVTDKRTYSFRFVLLRGGADAVPIFRLAVHAPPVRKTVAARPAPFALAVSPPPAPSSEDLVAERMKAAPEVLNSNYSIAEGVHSDDIVPTLIFDDGRFTYFRFPANLPLPAVFDLLGDGSETLANTRMEGDLLVVDRVSRRLMLRAGSAAVGVWNDDFDPEGRPPVSGATASGVKRLVKSESDSRVEQIRPGVFP